MNRGQYIDILRQTQAYLRHQREIYGEDIYYVCPETFLFLNDTYESMSLENLKVAIQDCQKCTLAGTRRHLVFGTGNPGANLMLIGEAPGQEEDLQGEPFVGKAGQLLDKILAAIEFQRDEVYIGNILKCRPPGNRDPLPEEIVQCMPYIEKQVEFISPKIILALGRIAAQTLLKKTDSLGRLRGAVHEFRGIPVIVTYHPAALLRNSQWKRFAWEDVQRLRHLYDKQVGDKPEWQPTRK